MRKYFLIYLVLVVSCKEKKEIDLNNITSLTLINKAQYCYGGKKEVVLSNKEEIDEILSLIQNPDKSRGQNIIFNSNYGYIEVLINASNDRFYDIIFTSRTGNIIRFKGLNYRNEELIRLTKSYLEMKDRNISIEGCE